MKLLRLLGAAAISVAALATSALADEGRYILLLKGNSVPADLAAQVESAGGQLVATMPQVGIAIATSSEANFIDSAKAIASVSDAGPEAVHTVPDVTEAPEPALTAPTGADDLYNAGLVWGVNRVGAPDAWVNGHTGSHNTVVAVIDTGVANNHPDLAPNIVEMNCFTSAPTCQAYPINSDHGTHVAGTIAAAFDAGRVVGVAPNTGIAAYNTFEFIPGCGVCSFSSSRWLAMLDAADKGYKVISMSLGSTAQFGGKGSNNLAAFVAAEKRIANYVDKQGTLMVASAGNNALDLNGTIIHLPGDIPQMINVGATGIQPGARYPFPNSFDIRAFYSNFGAALTVAAPGGDCGEINACTGAGNAGFPWFEFLVLSTTVALEPVCSAAGTCAPRYGWKGGTSMATPHVSAVAAMIFDANPGIKPSQVRAKLKQTAENVGSRQEFGHGMVRADKATE